jgi:hypothetical protein
MQYVIKIRMDCKCYAYRSIVLYLFFRRGVIGNIADFFQCSCFGLVRPVYVDWKAEFDFDQFSGHRKQTV